MRMTVQEVSAKYGVDESTIRRACIHKWIPAEKFGQQWAIRREDVEARWGKNKKKSTLTDE